ncbi:MAG: hypothetical protein JXL97_11470 [Bacteroidales bacterium]|nr:hypothetical protein [Bacteroidales bacterium]
MNQLIKDYFENIETKLITSFVIKSYNIIRKDISNSDGKIRIRAELINSDLIELFEYSCAENNEIIVQKYHFHWQNTNNELIKRWDNAPHHKELENFPHHIHLRDKVIKNNASPNILDIILIIEKTFELE